jgi:hypothetical protein
MATKEAVFNLRVNTGNSVKDVQTFDQSIQNLNKDIQEVQNTAASGTGIDTFDAKLAELNAKVEAGGLTMRQMTQVMKEYQTIAAQAGMESPVGRQAISAAAELKDEIGDLKAATTALSSDFVGLDTAVQGIETGTALFQGFESAVAMSGVESEALMQTMVKLQAAQGLANAATTIANNLNKDSILGIQLRTAAEKAYSIVVGQSVGSVKALRLAIAATGIGALVVGVAALSGAFSSANKEIDTNTKITDKAIEAAAGELNALDKLKGTINDENLTREEKTRAIKKLQEEYPSLLSNVDAEKSSIQEVNKALELNAQLVMLKAKSDAVASLRAEQYKTVLQNQIELEKYRKDGIEDLAGSMNKVLIEDAQEQINLLDEQDKSIQKQIENIKKRGASDDDIREKEKKTEDQRKKAEDAAKKRDEASKKRDEDAKKRAAEQAKIEQDRLNNLLKLEQDFRLQIQQVENEYQDSLLDAKTREENTIREKYFVLIQQAKQYGIDVTTLTKARQAELDKLDADYKQKEIEKQQELDKKKLDLYTQYRLSIADEFETELIQFEQAQADETKMLNDALQNNAITQEQYLLAQLRLEDEYNKKLIEINDKKNKAISDSNKKSLEERLAEVQQGIDIAQQALNTLSAINDLANQAGQNRIDELNTQAEEQTSALDKQQQEELSNANLTADEKKSIEEKFNKQKQEVLLKAFNEEEKIKKAQFERDKAFKISQIAIDTASAILKAIATYGPPPSPLGIFGIASAGAIGLAQAATVAATKYKGGTPPSVSSAGGGSVSTGASASTFTAANTNTQQTNLQDILGGASGGSQTSSKVYVVESDITATQQKVALQQQLSTY